MYVILKRCDVHHYPQLFLKSRCYAMRVVQNAINLWKENCSVHRRLDQTKKRLAQAEKTGTHQRYSENRHQLFILIGEFMGIDLL